MSPPRNPTPNPEIQANSHPLMETFWNTIADYNAATWPAQLLLVGIGAVLTLLLYKRPSPAVRTAMKIYMAVLNSGLPGSTTSSGADRGNITTCWPCSGPSWDASGSTTSHEARLARTDQTPYDFRPAALRHAARLPALFAGPGALVPDDHLARHALLRGSLHRRADARLLGTHQHRPGHVPLPLGPDRTLESLLFRNPRGLSAGLQRRPRHSISSSANTSKASKTGPQNPPRASSTDCWDFSAQSSADSSPSRCCTSSTSSQRFDPFGRRRLYPATNANPALIPVRRCPQST